LKQTPPSSKVNKLDRDLKGKEASLYSNDLSIDLEKMKKGNYLLQNFALFTG